MVAGSTTDTTYYMGSYEYKNGTINQILTSEGRVRYDNSNGTYHYDYYLKDHLGNIRVLYTKNADTAQVLQVNNYYPFGMRFGQSPSMQSQSNDYLYNGKELQKFGLDWYDYGARMYDPALGRWHSVDPKAEERLNISPYTYVQNNPILRIDPDGMLDDEYNFYEKDNRLEKVSEKGGDKTQYINFVNKNGQVQEQVSVSGYEAHVYNLRDGYVVTNFDAKLSEDYNSKSGYQYSIKDFNKRNEILNFTDDSPIKRALLSSEASGRAGTVHEDEYWDKYGHTVGTMLLGRFYCEMTLSLADFSPSLSRRASSFSLKSISTNYSGLNYKGTSGKAGTKIRNSWNRFLKGNKGKYKGKDWIKKATQDYYKSKYYNFK